MEEWAKGLAPLGFATKTPACSQTSQRLPPPLAHQELHERQGEAVRYAAPWRAAFCIARFLARFARYAAFCIARLLARCMRSGLPVLRSGLTASPFACPQVSLDRVQACLPRAL